MNTSTSAFKREQEATKLLALELKAIEDQIRMEKQEAQERERKQRIETLTQVAEDMRKNGASEQSIHTALKGFNEYLKPVSNEDGVPYLQWLGEDHHDVTALVVNTSLSTQRQAILRVLNNSQGPLALKDIADRTGQDYERIRKTVYRIRQAREVASLARGEFTTLGHPCITKSIHDNSDVPTETMETTETSVPK